MTKLFSAAAIAAVLITAAASAKAEDHKVTVVDRTITYDDAKLATPHGAARLLSRIENMAQQLCASSSPSVPHLDAQGRVCRTQAVARAVDALAAPLVTAAHADRRAAITVASR